MRFKHSKQKPEGILIVKDTRFMLGVNLDQEVLHLYRMSKMYSLNHIILRYLHVSCGVIGS